MDSPFDRLMIDDSSWLDEMDTRVMCHKCQRSRKYYCYTCYVPVGGIDDRLPKVQLPLKIDIIKHPNETDGKSTAAHAAILSPDHVTVYTYPCIPHYSDKGKILLVFPGDESVTLSELKEQLQTTTTTTTNQINTETKSSSKQRIIDAETTRINTDNMPVESQLAASDMSSGSSEKLSEETVEGQEAALSSGLSPYHTVVFIDSTWAQTKKIFKDERLKGLVRVELKSQVTKFWRHQNDKPDTYLATIEAIYYFLLEYHNTFSQQQYTGQFDNLLLFFTYMYKKLQTLYGGDKKRKKIDQKGSDRKKTKSENV